MQVKLSTRPRDFIGDIVIWDRAEAALGQALSKESIEYQVSPGDGAFYGPKIDFVVLDALRRSWQLATIQLDFFLPERFELAYTSASGADERPVMIHRALLGSIERFMGILIEHCAGAFPLWIAPVQVRILTVTDEHKNYAKEVMEKMRNSGRRVELDERNEKLGYKIREAQLAKIPYAVVIGEKEVQAQTVAPRRRGGENLPPLSVNEFIERLSAEIAQERGAA
jgi:threonyl-tRNA synthetase